MKIKKTIYSSALCLVINFLLLYAAYFVCRWVYMLVNWNAFANEMSWGAAALMMKGGLVFDTSALVYLNLLYVLMMLFPMWWKQSDVWQRVAKWVFIVTNSVGIAMNLADAVYFQYTGRRTTATVFSEFGNEGNLFGIVAVEFVRHWYLVLLFAAMVWALWHFYAIPSGRRMVFSSWKGKAKYIGLQVLFLVAGGVWCVGGIRGGLTHGIRPITISNANQYATTSAQAAAVLNTPFSVIRTIGKAVFADPGYMTPAEMDAAYSPLHQAADSVAFRKKNVVVIILESFGREYVGAYNRTLDGGAYKGYTPFLDQLIAEGTTWEITLGNGRKSIDGMPSVLSGIPMFVEPFFLTPSSMNRVSGIAGELGKVGYYSAFFHGAPNGSMGFEAFARASGFRDYFGLNEYNADGRFGGDADFDGTWAIWDEPFLQYYALKMSDFREPFVTAVFTASSHHPFRIPEEYRGKYPEENLPIHKCVRYTDNALREFFETAKRQPWYDNTLFVITADHTNESDHAFYSTDFGRFYVPIVIYDPSGEIVPGVREGIAQQIDIMPTVLGYLGYPGEYVAFGRDLFAPGPGWSVGYSGGIYHYVEGDRVLFFDGERTKGLYALRGDSLLRADLSSREAVELRRLEHRLKAIIQAYMLRMTTDRLVPEE